MGQDGLDGSRVPCEFRVGSGRVTLVAGRVKKIGPTSNADCNVMYTTLYYFSVTTVYCPRKNDHSRNQNRLRA